jgi:hypothetical protein
MDFDNPEDFIRFLRHMGRDEEENCVTEVIGSLKF